MTDLFLFVQELQSLCHRENLGMVIDAESKCIIFPESGCGNIKIFHTIHEMAFYSAFKISEITGRRLPDPIHNRMVLEGSKYPFANEYLGNLSA